MSTDSYKELSKLATSFSSFLSHEPYEIAQQLNIALHQGNARIVQRIFTNKTLVQASLTNVMNNKNSKPPKQYTIVQNYISPSKGNNRCFAQMGSNELKNKYFYLLNITRVRNIIEFFKIINFYYFS